MRRFEGKVVVVTGGASGVGQASIRRFRSEGAQVVSVDLRADEDAMPDVRWLQADVTDPEQVERVVAETLQAFGAIDVYFNNAGVLTPPTPVEETRLEHWRSAIEANMTAFFLGARAVVEPMRRAGGGVLLLTASVAARRPRPGLAPYVAAKGGALALAQELALELAPSNIRVNVIAPVAIDTPMLDLMGPRGGRSDTVAKLVSTIPLGRLATPDDVAAAAAYLASDDASFLTGVVLNVDGGRSL